MLGFALFGTGRIGQLHAENISRHPNARLVSVFDVNPIVAQQIATRYGARPAADVEDALCASGVDAVLIASSTHTHVDLLIRAVKAGKAVLCEKPIDLDIDRVERCREEIAAYSVPVQIGFNRRWDPGHRKVAEAVKRSEIGALEQLIITSRDPGMPTIEYLKDSGGIFRDMTIHDFDMARYMLGEEPIEIIATGSSLIDPEVLKIGDIDSVMVLLRTASGKLCHINNARRACYGYDQRIEAFGSLGMLISGNRTITGVEHYRSDATAVREPLFNFFTERYADAYRNQLDAFIHAIQNGVTPTPNFEDGRRALLLADAALQSLQSSCAVTLSG